MTCLGCPGCDGGGGCVEPGIAGCVICNPAPGGWLVKIRGIVNDSCTDCSILNGDFIVPYSSIDGSSQCFWSYSDSVSVCGSSMTRQILVGLAGGFLSVTYSITSSSISDAYTWRLAAASVSCTGVNTLSLSLTSPIHCNVSASTCTVELITIAPASSCSPAAPSGYTLCPWPTLTGTGCLPGGNCADYNSKACLAWVSNNRWESNRRTIDCTTTYGVVVDAQWVMTFDSSSNVTLNLYVYLTGTSTLVATIATYGGQVSLASCASCFSVGYVSDGGQCGNWPKCLIIRPLCCADCSSARGCGCNPQPSSCIPFCGTNIDPPFAVIHGFAPTNGSCTDCASVYTGANVILEWTTGNGVGCQDSYTLVTLGWCQTVFDLTFGFDLTMHVDPGGLFLDLTGILNSPHVAATIVRYRCVSFDCDINATNTFTKVSSHPSCNFPTTVTQTWL